MCLVFLQSFGSVPADFAGLVTLVQYDVVQISDDLLTRGHSTQLTPDAPLGTATAHGMQALIVQIFKTCSINFRYLQTLLR